MPLSLNAAAKHAHVAKSTLHEALKSGAVKAEKNGQGQWDIDRSSLAQWISNRSEKPRQNQLENQSERPEKPPSEPPDSIKAAVLQARLEASEGRLEDAQATIEDLRKRLDQSEAERIKKDTQLTALLEDQRVREETAKAEVEAKPEGFFKRLFG